jgi:hypothetical protein
MAEIEELKTCRIAKERARKDENHNWHGKGTPRHKEDEDFHANSF